MEYEANRMNTDKFWSNVAKGAADECWKWTRARHPKGYGQVWLAGKMRRAHRVAWELSNGPIPEGLHVLHRCDNPPCCNPAHLFLGTNADNVQDRDAKGRRVAASGDQHYSRTNPEAVARGEQNGRAKLTEADVSAIRASTETHREIAAQFGVDRSTISDIRRREIWRHVE